MPQAKETCKYCKRGYFRWGKISRKYWQDISRGGNFQGTTPISFREAYGFYFRAGIIFAKNAKAQKTRKLPPRKNFHVYSTVNCLLFTAFIFAITIPGTDSQLFTMYIRNRPVLYLTFFVFEMHVTDILLAFYICKNDCPRKNKGLANKKTIYSTISLDITWYNLPQNSTYLSI